ncbi:cytochrome P450 [Mesorhizobium sp. ZMM04-5]|uniref:Cytochrome P450 n=1 Tax=Mesorhizobium marinum TaxID=3228790 RepID=A0ABV3QVX3_9HYPH
MGVYHVDAWRTLPLLARIARDPISATRALHAAHGPFVRIRVPFPTKSGSRQVSLIADSDLYRTVMSDGNLWVNVQITWGGIPNHASNRLSLGMTRLRGERHEHYRKMFVAPLKRPVVAAMSPEMARVAAAEMAKWPRGVPVDLQHAITVMTTKLAVALLFGSDFERALPITDLITRQFKAFRILPGRHYLRWVWNAPRQERAIMEWAAEKRGNRDAHDLLSVLVNNPDLDGLPPSTEIICGIICFLYAAAYDTCLNGITWTLLLLTQHPEIMRALTAEIEGALDGELPTMDRVGQLLLLDRVIREGMRLMPPVPLQMRRAGWTTTLGGEAVEHGERTLISSHLICRDPGVYDEPDSFKPDRWRAVRPSPFQYPVFGAGGHMCPGVTFGLQMVKIALSTILSSGRIELARAMPVDYRTAVTMQPVGKVDVVLRDRTAKLTYPRASGGLARLVALPG